MVEKNLYLDGLFGSLADPFRRDMLRRLMEARYTIGQLAEVYDISFAAVAKHLQVLEKTKLITKTRRGNSQVVAISPAALRDAATYLQQYEMLWGERFNIMDSLLKEEK